MRTASETQGDAAEPAQVDPLDEVIRGLRETQPDLYCEKLGLEMGDGFTVRGLAIMPTPQQWTMVRIKLTDPDPAQKVAGNRLLFNFALKAYIDQDGLTVAKGGSGGELAPLVKRYPALVDTWAGEIAEMAGARKGTVREKA